jgi:hypothetical protein
VAPYCSSPVALTLAISGGPSIDLMSDQQGFRVQSLDLGYPAVREVVTDRADRRGQYDLTRLFGARPVTISGAVVPSAAGSRQKAWHLLAPFLDPSQRVTMTYQVDGDAVTKTMTLRAAQATALFDHPGVSPAQVGFKAADPVAYDQNTQTAYLGPYQAQSGRAYNLVFNRAYPSVQSGSAATANHGDLTSFPVLRLYGPATGIWLQWAPASPGQPIVTWSMYFLSSFQVNAGDYLAIDCGARTVYLNGDPSQNRYNQVDFARSSGGWPFIPAGGSTTWFLQVATYSTATQLQVSWADAYLL